VEVSGIISAVVVGLIIGALGRLVVPGKQDIPIWLTLILGLVGAFVGSFIAASFTENFIITLILQVLIAAGLVYVVANMKGRGARV
jgi:uncharacterized membrane protein YeaQ/YmgE (transglycosylase-associated protein family)